MAVTSIIAEIYFPVSIKTGRLSGIYKHNVKPMLKKSEKCGSITGLLHARVECSCNAIA
jgi:hypothetical protein